MGLIVLFAVGAVLAWLASILARADDARSIAINVAVGVLGALAFGVLTAEGSLIAGISPTTLLAGATGASVTLVLFALARLRTAR